MNPPATSPATVVTTIGVETYFVGMHCWPDAPAHRSYLATPHRHRFGVKVVLSVNEHDREVEFHDLLDVVKVALPCALVQRSDEGNPYLSMSCEHHAARIADAVARAYPSRYLTVVVDEDGECFARVEYIN